MTNKSPAPAPSAATRASLLLRIRDAGDRRAWDEFIDVYAPLIHGFCRKQGLQDADAADVTQDAMTRVHRSIASFDYDPRLGRFRGWLFTLVRRLIHDLLDRQKRPGRGAGDSEAQRRLAEAPAPSADLEAEWDADFRRQVYARAAKIVQGDVAAETWQAFQQTAILGRTPAAVAAELGTTLATIYLAKSRVMARLRSEVAALAGNDGEGGTL